MSGGFTQRPFVFQGEPVSKKEKDAKPHVALRERLIAEAAEKMNANAVMTSFVDMMEIVRRHVDRLNIHERWLYDRAYQTLRENADIRLQPDSMTCPKDRSAK
jgi:hypothetical protein